MNSMNVAIIPARGGSKRIPRKNIKAFCGKPMIAWSIEAARASGCFDRVIVSTDDQEIADVAADAGADVPFLRSAELSDDYTGTVPVIRHALEHLESQGQTVALACCIYATAPFVQPDDLQAGLERMQETGVQYAFSVTSFPFPIQRAIRLQSSGAIEMFYPEHLNTRSQDLEEAWHDAGQFYWGRAAAWRNGEAIFAPHSRPVILPRHRVQDVDTPEDWERAEWLFKAMMASTAGAL